jgi:hypothetical protein
MSYSNNTIINPKPCNYGCNTRIYWNASENAYFEVFSRNRHQCPNRSSSTNKNSSSTTKTGPAAVITNNKPKYYSNYNKFSNKQLQQPKPKVSNSLELLQGSIAEVQKKYEILSDVVSEANGKVHGSQSHILAGNSVVSLIVYYEVPEGEREKTKRKFENLARSQKSLQRNY